MVSCPGTGISTTGGRSATTVIGSRIGSPPTGAPSRVVSTSSNLPDRRGVITPENSRPATASGLLAPSPRHDAFASSAVVSPAALRRVPAGTSKVSPPVGSTSSSILRYGG